MKRGLSPRWAIDAAGVGLLAGLSLAAYTWAYCPWTEHAAEASRAQHDLAAEREAARQAAERLGESRRLLMETQARLALEGTRLEPLDRLNGRLAAMADAAAAGGLEIEELAPGHVALTEHEARVPIRLSGRGGYGAVVAFLHRLRTAMPDVSATSVELTSNPHVPQTPARFRLALEWHAAPG